MRSSTPPRGDQGDTLIELLASVVILGLVFAAILGIIADDIRGTTMHRQMATARAITASATEYVKGHATATGCNPIVIPSTEVSVPPGYAVSAVAIGYVAADGTVDRTVCDASRPRLYKVAVTAPGVAAESVEVVVR